MPNLLNSHRFGAPAVATPDIEVKSYYWTETSTLNDTGSSTIDAVTVANAFARTNTLGYPAHGAVGTGSGNEDSNNFMMMPEVTGTTTVTHNYDHDTRDVTMEGWYEVWEYVGDPGGANEFKVLHAGEVAMTAAATNPLYTMDVAASNVDNCVAMITGVGANAFGTNSEFKGDRLCYRIEVTSTTQFQLNRHDNNQTTEAGVVVLEFTGSNWTVNKTNISHPSSTLGSSTHTIPSVGNWANTMYFWSYEVNHGGVGSDDVSCLGYPGSGSVTQFKTDYQVSHGSSPNGTLYTVHNADMDVEHNDTIDGTANTAVASARPTTTISAPADHDLTTSVMANGNSTLNGTDNTALGWIYWLSDSTTFATDYAGGSSADHDIEYAFQIVDMNGVAS